jgi:4-carboxymuconolactone decarboxylase
MTNRILLGAIVEREGRILLIRQTPRSQWELPGGELQARQTDADAAMAEALDTFGITMTEPEERFIETLYMPDGDGQIIYNLYSAGDWTGEPEIPIGMGAGWFAFDELDAINIQDEIRSAVLVAYGLKEAPDNDAAILQAMSGAAATSAPQQPQLGARPTVGTGSVWSPKRTAEASDEPPDAEVVPELREEPMEDTPLANSPFARPSTSAGSDDDLPGAAPEDTELVAEALGVPDAANESFEAEDGTDTSRISSLAQIADSLSQEHRLGMPVEPVIGGGWAEVPISAMPDRRSRGLDVLRTLSNAPDPGTRLDAMNAQYPELADAVVDFALGEVWSGEALTRRERSLLVVAMLSALGGRTGPLTSHMNGALNHGATPDELVETLRMVAVYAGFPAALEAWKVMEATFANRDVFPSGREQ